MNDDQDPDSNSQFPNNESQGGSSQSTPPDVSNRDDLNSNAAEIAGETTEVVPHQPHRRRNSPASFCLLLRELPRR